MKLQNSGKRMLAFAVLCLVPFLAASADPYSGDRRCGPTIEMKIDGDVYALKSGDMFCLSSEKHGDFCHKAEDTNATYTCPTSQQIVTCAADCSICTTNGENSPNECHGCCSYYHPDPNGRLNCIRNFC